MKRLQTVLKQNHVSFIIFALALVVLSGCVAGRSDTANTAENETQKTQQKTSESEQQNKTVLEDIQISRTGDAVHVLLRGSRKLEYTSIKQSFPFGIAVYMPETEFSAGIDPVVPEDTNVHDILLSYADENRKTAKLLILLDDNVTYSVRALKDSELMVEIPQSSAMARNKEPIEDEKAEPSTTMQNTISPSDIPEGTAELTGIEFTRDISAGDPLTEDTLDL